MSVAADVAKSKAKSIAGGFLNPGIGIVTSGWQGIVEIVLRGVILVSV